MHGHVRGLQTRQNLTVVFTSRTSGTTEVKTEPDGSFRTSVPAAGVYSAELRSVQFLSSTRRQCTVLADDTECNLDLPDTRLDISITRGSEVHRAAVGLYVSGPVSPTDSHVMGFVTGQEAGGFSLFGLGHGSYSIVAYTRDGLTSASPLSLSLTPDRAMAASRIEMVRRTLRIRIQDRDGARIPAIVQSQLRRLTFDGSAFDADGIPAGMPVQVQAVGFVPSCRYVAAAGSQQIIVMDRASSLGSYVTLTPNPGRPMGLVDGVPGSECGVDVSGFRMDQTVESPPGSFRFGILGLPPGNYRFRAAAMAPPVTMAVPGKSLQYTVPPACLICI